MDNLVGRRFGRLTVLKRADDHITTGGRKLVSYACICDCGNEKIVLANRLRDGKTRSCGCIAKEQARTSIQGAAKASADRKREKRESLIGTRFGRLTVLSIEDNGGTYFARCQCGCGEIAYISINNLLCGRSSQCKKCQMEDLHKKFQATEMVDGTALCKLTQKKRCDNSTGVKGVYIDKRTGKFVAEIRLKGKKYWIGQYSRLEDAKKARAQAEQELFDPILERHGRPLTSSTRISGEDHNA